MLFIIASLSKNQLYQFNQIKKVPTIIKQDEIGLFQIFLYVILLLSRIYFPVITIAGFWFPDTRGYVEG